MPQGAKFYICEKCKAGARADLEPQILTKVFKFDLVALVHRRGCGGRLRLYDEAAVGAGEDAPIRSGSN